MGLTNIVGIAFVTLYGSTPSPHECVQQHLLEASQQATDDPFYAKFNLYKSHFGEWASLHCMASNETEHSYETLAELHLWWNFLQDIVLQKLAPAPNSTLRSLDHHSSPLFNSTRSTVKDFFGTNSPAEIRLRSLGMLVHLLQDSYTESHCLRLNCSRIDTFFHFGTQDHSLHEKKDDVLPAQYQELIDQTMLLLSALLNGQEVSFSTIFSAGNGNSLTSKGPC
jgi:hypothetical protein